MLPAVDFHSAADLHQFYANAGACAWDSSSNTLISLPPPFGNLTSNPAACLFQFDSFAYITLRAALGSGEALLGRGGRIREGGITLRAAVDAKANRPKMQDHR